MGFSVSGATVVILLGLLIGFGMFYTVADTSVTRVVNAHEERADRVLETQNTDFSVLNATYNNSNGQLTVLAMNDGSTALSVERTTVLVEGNYDPFLSMTVEDAEASDLWLPGDTLRIESTDYDATPDRLKIITEYGVSRTTTVETIESEEDP